MTSLIDAAADLLLGGRCPGCGTPGWRLCAGCRAVIEAPIPRSVARDPSPPLYPFTVAGADYNPTLRRVITAFKEDQVYSAGPLLGRRLGLAVARLLTESAAAGRSFLLVPIPSAPAAVRNRGLDCTRCLARTAARLLMTRAGAKMPVVTLLRQRGWVEDQAGLDSVGRRENLAGALVARPAPPGRTAILVDDVTTTGTTLAEAHRALRAAGIPVLGAAVVAATVRRGSAGGAALAIQQGGGPREQIPDQGGSPAAPGARSRGS